MRNQVLNIDERSRTHTRNLHCQTSSARLFNYSRHRIKVRIFISIIISCFIYVSYNVTTREDYHTGFQSYTKNDNIISIKELSQKEAVVMTNKTTGQLFGLPQCASQDDYPLLRMWKPVKCPDEGLKIGPWAIQRGMMARELNSVAAALVSNNVSAVRALSTAAFLTAVMTMDHGERRHLAHFLKEAANRLLRWRVVDVGANKGYVLTETIEALLGHFQQTDRDYITKSHNGSKSRKEREEMRGVVDAKLPLGVMGANMGNEEINKYTSRSLALGLYSQYEVQHPSRKEQASSTIGATEGKSLVSSYLPIDPYTYYSLCGACCDCGKVADRAVEKALSSEGQTAKGDGDGKGGGSIEDLSRYRPQQLEIHAYEPSIINYRWLAHFYNPTTTRRSTVYESPPSSSHYLGLGGNRLNISIYNMGVGKTSGSGAVKGRTVSSDGNRSADTVAYFPMSPLGNEIGKIQFTPGPEHRRVSLTSLDGHLLPILRQREEAIMGYKPTRGVMPSSKTSNADGKSDVMRPPTSDPLYFPIDVLYTDTEGFDEYVAQGADFLLSNNMVSIYQFEIGMSLNYTAVFDKLSSYNYVCYFETESVKGAKIPKFIRITHGCWWKEYEKLSGWMNAICYHMTLLEHSVTYTRDMEGNGRDGAYKEMSSRIDWDSLLMKKHPNRLTVDINSEISRKWAASMMLEPLRGIFVSLEKSYHNTKSPWCCRSAEKQRRYVRKFVARNKQSVVNTFISRYGTA